MTRTWSRSAAWRTPCRRPLCAGWGRAHPARSSRPCATSNPNSAADWPRARTEPTMSTTTQLVTATINNLPVEVKHGATILDAARQVSVHIPTLCKHPDLDATAACGICIVRVAGTNKMLRACCTPLEDGMEITTEDPEIIHVRRTVVEMILSKHPNECLRSEERRVGKECR